MVELKDKYRAHDDEVKQVLKETFEFRNKNAAVMINDVNYWTFGDYLGIGAGAHGKITDTNNQQIQRYSKQRHPQRYLDSARTENVIVEKTQLTRADAILEFMMNALRLCNGFASSLFNRHTGLPISAIQDQLAQAEERGWIHWSTTRIQTTETGIQFLNDLLTLFMQVTENVE